MTETHTTMRMLMMGGVSSRVQSCALAVDLSEIAITKLARVLFPIEMAMANAAACDEPMADDDVALSWMGSGGSDRVTVGEVRAALACADAAMVQIQHLRETLTTTTP